MQKTLQGLPTEEWISTRRLASQFGVALGTPNVWRCFKGFPDDARRKIEGRIFWHRPSIERWQQSRPKALKAAQDRHHEEVLATYTDFAK